MYSVYVLDLVFIMPAFFMLALLILKDRKIGLLLTPAIMILGFFVIFPLGLNELAKPLFGQSIIVPTMMVSFLFSFLMLGVGLVHLRKLTIRVIGEQENEYFA